PVADVLRYVNAVATINSTAGVEALLHGVPVVTLGVGFYRRHGLTYDVENPAELPYVLPHALRRPGPDLREVERLVAWFMSIGYEMAYIGDDDSPANADAYARALIDEFALARAPASVPGDATYPWYAGS